MAITEILVILGMIALLMYLKARMDLAPSKSIERRLKRYAEDARKRVKPRFINARCSYDVQKEPLPGDAEIVWLQHVLSDPDAGRFYSIDELYKMDAELKRLLEARGAGDD